MSARCSAVAEPMLHVLAWVAIALAVANVLGVATLIYQRVRIRRRDTRRDELEAHVTPLALALLDGKEPGELDAGAQLALVDVLSRYSRLVRGAPREHIAAYFAGSAAYQRALHDLSARKRWRRTAAAFTLGDMAVPAATPELRRALHDRDREVRAAAARSLGKLQDVDAVEELTEALASATVPRLVAARALLEIGEPALVELLALLDRPDAAVRATASELVGLLGSARDAPLLIEHLSDPSAAVREQAAIALGRLGAGAATSALISALDDRVGFVRAAAAGALGAIGDATAKPVLLEVARSDSFEAAHAAAYAVLALDPEAAARSAGSVHLDEIADVARVRG